MTFYFKTQTCKLTGFRNVHVVWTDLFDDQGLQHNCSQTIVLEWRQERWLMEDIHSHHINSCWRKDQILTQNGNSLHWLSYISFIMKLSCFVVINRCFAWKKYMVFSMPYTNEFLTDQTCLVKMTGYWSHFLDVNSVSFLNNLCKMGFGKINIKTILSSCLANNPHTSFFARVSQKQGLSWTFQRNKFPGLLHSH